MRETGGFHLQLKSTSTAWKSAKKVVVLAAKQVIVGSPARANSRKDTLIPRLEGSDQIVIEAGLGEARTRIHSTFIARPVQ